MTLFIEGNRINILILGVNATYINHYYFIILYIYDFTSTKESVIRPAMLCLLTSSAYKFSGGVFFFCFGSMIMRIIVIMEIMFIMMIIFIAIVMFFF